MPDYTKIAREFPDYPIESIPEGIPNWLEPVPWHDDAMPIWGDERYVEGGESGTALSIDHPDPQLREGGPGWPRFVVFTLQDGEATGDNLATEDWDEALAELRRRSGL